MYLESDPAAWAPQSGEAAVLVLSSGVELSTSQTSHISILPMARNARLYFLIHSTNMFFIRTVYHFCSGYWDPVMNNIDKLPALTEFILQSKKQQTTAHGSNPVHYLFL